MDDGPATFLLCSASCQTFSMLSIVNVSVLMPINAPCISCCGHSIESQTQCIGCDVPRVQKAEAQLAYELQAAKEQQKIRLEEIEIQVVQRKKQITIEEKEISRMDRELIATVKRPAEAEAYRMQQLAEGHK